MNKGIVRAIYSSLGPQWTNLVMFVVQEL